MKKKKQWILHWNDGNKRCPECDDSGVMRHASDRGYSHFECSNCDTEFYLHFEITDFSIQ
jgi:transposase-like protein